MNPKIAMAETGERDLRFPEKLDHDFLECRSLRHQFNLVYFGPIRGLPPDLQPRLSPSTIVRQAECNRCGVIKEDFFNPTNASRASMGLTFTSFHRRYRYPPGYQWDGLNSTKERPTNADYNYELYKRFSRQ